MTALVFDCDGVLADTERYGHLPAFNQMFAELGLPVHWSEDDYAGYLRIGGGKERLASLLTPAFVREAGLPADRQAQSAEIARWHRRKTEIFVAMTTQGRIPPRSGVARLTRDAMLAGWSLAVCSTSAEPSVRAILQAAVGAELAAGFLVLAGDIVARKKPAPEIYQLALERLDTDRSSTIVIEDSRNGLLAAAGAGLTTVVTINGYTEHEDFSEAALVITALGDPDGEETRVIVERCGARPGSYMTLADLEACLAQR